MANFFLLPGLPRCNSFQGEAASVHRNDSQPWFQVQVMTASAKTVRGLSDCQRTDVQVLEAEWMYVSEILVV
jgi:hypothetical protein